MPKVILELGAWTSDLRGFGLTGSGSARVHCSHVRVRWHNQLISGYLSAKYITWQLRFSAQNDHPLNPKCITWLSPHINSQKYYTYEN